MDYLIFSSDEHPICKAFERRAGGVVTVNRECLCMSPESIETHFVENPIQLPADYSDALNAVFVAGNAINFGALAALEPFKEKKISVSYIIPDMSLESEASRKNHEIVFGILQQYARSGKFQRFVIFDVRNVEQMLDNLTFGNYNELVFDTIAYSMVVFDSLSGEKFTTKKEVDDAARLETLGFFDLRTGVKKLCFNLQDTCEMNFNFLVKEEQINSSNFHKEVKLRMKLESTDKRNVSFSIYVTEQEERCLLLCRSKVIQKTKE